MTSNLSDKPPFLTKLAKTASASGLLPARDKEGEASRVRLRSGSLAHVARTDVAQAAKQDGDLFPLLGCLGCHGCRGKREGGGWARRLWEEGSHVAACTDHAGAENTPCRAKLGGPERRGWEGDAALPSSPLHPCHALSHPQPCGQAVRRLSLSRRCTTAPATSVSPERLDGPAPVVAAPPHPPGTPLRDEGCDAALAPFPCFGRSCPSIP